MVREVQQIADNVYVTVIARFAMIFASVIVLPVGGYLAIALISRIDGLVMTQQKEEISIALFADRFERIQSSINEAVQDRYRMTDAARDFALRDSKIIEQARRNDEQDKRIDDQEARINTLGERKQVQP